MKSLGVFWLSICYMHKFFVGDNALNFFRFSCCLAPDEEAKLHNFTKSRVPSGEIMIYVHTNTSIVMFIPTFLLLII